MHLDEEEGLMMYPERPDVPNFQNEPYPNRPLPSANTPFTSPANQHPPKPISREVKDGLANLAFGSAHVEGDDASRPSQGEPEEHAPSVESMSTPETSSRPSLANILISGEPLSDETVLDMPEQERGVVATGLERFAAGGERYTYTYEGALADEQGQFEDFEETEQGYKRTVPRQLLEAEGLDYQVEVNTMDATGSNPYLVGVRATRVIDIDMGIPTGDGTEGAPHIVEGEETKTMAFSAESLDPALEPVLTMTAESDLIAPRSLKIDFGDPTAHIRIMLDGSTPLLRLDEARAIARAVAAANELPPDAPEFTTEYAPPYRAPYPEQPATDYNEGEQGETFIDLTQERRRQMVNEIDAYAKGGADPVEEHGVRRYERSIPQEVLRGHGIAGEVKAVAMEGVDHRHYRYGLVTSERVNRALPGQEDLGVLPGVKEAFYGFFEVGGRRDGTHGMGGTEDSTGGDGIHTTYGGQTFFWRHPEDIGNSYKVWHAEGIPDITFTDARNLHNALRQARLGGDRQG